MANPTTNKTTTVKDTNVAEKVVMPKYAEVPKTVQKATETAKAVETKTTVAKEAPKAEKKVAKVEEPAKKEAKAEKKTTTKNAAKKTTKKAPVEKIQEVFIEHEGNQILTKELVQRIEEAYKNEGHRISSIKSLRVYINLGERKAYYVINDKEEGKFVEF